MVGFWLSPIVYAWSFVQRRPAVGVPQRAVPGQPGDAGGARVPARAVGGRGRACRSPPTWACASLIAIADRAARALDLPAGLRPAAEQLRPGAVMAMTRRRPWSRSPAPASASSSARRSRSRSGWSTSAGPRRTRTTSGRCGTSTWRSQRVHRRPDRPQRLGQVDAAQADRRHPAADHRHGRTPRPAGRAARARRRLPPRPDRPGERLPERVDPRPVAASRRRPFFDAIVAFSGIEQFIDTQVKFYSSGMYVRLAFAVVRARRPGRPAGRRGAGGRRRAVPAQVHGPDPAVPARGPHHHPGHPRPGPVADLCDRAVVLEHGQIAGGRRPVDALRHLRADFEAMRQEDIDQQRERGRRGPIAAAAGSPAVSVTDHGRDTVTVDRRRAPDLLVNVDIDVDGTVARSGRWASASTACSARSSTAPTPS